eukprot:SAG31_NODE_7870_length_1577_cov_5.207037_1_plen_158_part_10
MPTKVELQQECRSRGLPFKSRDTKPVLQQRLNDDEAARASVDLSAAARAVDLSSVPDELPYGMQLGGPPPPVTLSPTPVTLSDTMPNIVLVGGETPPNTSSQNDGGIPNARQRLRRFSSLITFMQGSTCDVAVTVEERGKKEQLRAYNEFVYQMQQEA